MIKAGFIFFLISLAVHLLIGCFLFKEEIKHVMISGAVISIIATPFWIMLMKYYLKAVRKTNK